MTNFIKTKLKLDVSIRTGNKLGEHVGLVELENMQNKENRMKNKSKQRRLADPNLLIKTDLKEKEQKFRKKIIKIARKSEKAVKLAIKVKWVENNENIVT